MNEPTRTTGGTTGSAAPGYSLLGVLSVLAVIVCVIPIPGQAGGPGRDLITRSEYQELQGTLASASRDSLSAMARDGSDGTPAAITTLGGLSSTTIRAEIDADVATVAGDLTAHTGDSSDPHGPVLTQTTISCATFTVGTNHCVRYAEVQLASGSHVALSTLFPGLALQRGVLTIVTTGAEDPSSGINAAIYHVRGSANESVEMSDSKGSFAVASGTAGSINVIANGGSTYTIQNLRYNAMDFVISYQGRK